MTAIDVADVDVDNVVVALTDGLTVQGRITVERVATNAAVDLTRLRVLLERDPDVVGAPSGGLAFNPPAEADGTFTLGGVKPGDYRVSLPPILTRFGEPAGGLRGPAVPEALRNSYVKSIRWGRADILADGLHTSTAAQGPLEVVISLDGAHVEGIVLDNARAPAVNVVVAIVPDGDNRQRLDLYKTASTDRTGRFEFHGMPPGDYTVYAWYDVEFGAWQNAEPNVTVALVPDAARRARFDLYRSATSDAAGRFRIPDVPPGDYTALAFDGVEGGEWQSAEFVAPYEGRGKPVRVVDGAPASVELIALPPPR